MQTLQLLCSNKHLQQSEIHTLIMQMTERKKKTKPKTCSERLQFKFFSHANIKPKELRQYKSPLAVAFANQW